MLFRSEAKEEPIVEIAKVDEQEVVEDAVKEETATVEKETSELVPEPEVHPGDVTAAEVCRHGGFLIVL